jgi:hypothetical protein
MRLILTSDQIKQLASATGSVDVVDANGLTIGYLTLGDPAATETHELTEEDFAELRRHMQQSPADKVPSFKTHQVRDPA